MMDEEEDYDEELSPPPPRLSVARRRSSISSWRRRVGGLPGLAHAPWSRRRWRESPCGGGLGPRRRRSSAARRLGAIAASAAPRERDAYRAYFELVAESPSEELTVVKDLTTPLIKSTPVTLPFDLSAAVADNCLSLSAMGYHLGVGGCCPTCAARGEPRLGRNDRAALILAYVQQINDIYHYRGFLASVVALGARLSPEEPGPETQRVLARVVSAPELFFAYYVLRDAGVRDARVLFYPDHESPAADYMMYVVFPGKSVHLHYRLLDCLQAACRGYRIIAHVWQTAFVLVVRREGDRQADSEGVPSVSAEDIYCKLCDLNIDGELLLEYAKLYAAFDEFLPPR